MAALVLLLTPALFADATIEGRVSLAKAEQTPVMNKRYSMTARGGNLATLVPRALVFVEGSFPAPAAPATAQLEQRGVEFVPYLLPVRTGTRVEFPNHDSTDHSIYSDSAAASFNLGRCGAAEHPVPSRVFDRPGVVTLRCDLHENMRAEIVVLDTPYFVVTEPDGHYRLTGLPAGHYTLKVWLSRKTTLERPVDLTDGGSRTEDFR